MPLVIGAGLYRDRARHGRPGVRSRMTTDGPRRGSASSICRSPPPGRTGSRCWPTRAPRWSRWSVPGSVRSGVGSASRSTASRSTRCATGGSAASRSTSACRRVATSFARSRHAATSSCRTGARAWPRSWVVGSSDLRSDDLVYVSISGFGDRGPSTRKGAYDTVIQAYGGIRAGAGRHRRARVRAPGARRQGHHVEHVAGDHCRAPPHERPRRSARSPVHARRGRARSSGSTVRATTPC